MSAAGVSDIYLVNTSNVLPSIFVLGPPKAASSFLWECLHASFHPATVCGSDAVAKWSDSACGESKPILLPGLRYASFTGACFHPTKEGCTPWTNEVKEHKMRWHVWGGPPLPMRLWQTSEPRNCGHRNNSAFNEFVEDRCMADAPCPVDERAASYSAEVSSSCMHQCNTCELQQGFDVRDSAGRLVHRPCEGREYQCASKACTVDKVVSKRLNFRSPSGENVSYRATHKRNFRIETAFPHRAELSHLGVSPRRVRTFDGNPGLFSGGGVGLALPMAASMTATGLKEARFIVGYRAPVSYVLSYWAFEGKYLARLEQYMDAAIARVSKCEAAVGAADRPDLLLTLSDGHWREYSACMVDADNYVASILYAVHFTRWFRAGFQGAQFLLVPTKSMSDGHRLHQELATFLGLPSQQARKMCTSVTNSHHSSEDKRFVSAKNKTVGQIRAAYVLSTGYTRLKAYLNRHDALLPSVLAEGKVGVHGGLAALAAEIAENCRA